MKEIFKDIPGYEGYYIINNLGYILHKKYNRPIKLQTNGWGGYVNVCLWKNNKPKKYFVHRLVLEVFKGKSNLICNHKDGNKLNNNIENLEYCTYSENLKHAYDNKLRKSYFIGKFGKLHPKSKKINQYSLDGKFIKTWNSGMDIQRKLGINQGNISGVCQKKRKTLGGYKWEYFKINYK